MMLGPLTPSHTHEVEEVTPAPASPLARSVAVARAKGWRVVVGKWLVTGHPTVVLFDTDSAAGQLFWAHSKSLPTDSRLHERVETGVVREGPDWHPPQ